MDHTIFIQRVRPVFRNRVSESQQKALAAILSIWEGAPTTHVAYALATVLAECGANMRPVREGFAKTDAGARAHAKKHYWTMKSGRPGYGRPTGPFEQVYYGRGYVQLTWLANYQKATKEIGTNFVRDPDLALLPANAALIMRRGMEQGWFTGKKLSDYLDDVIPDYVNARRIINGKDRAREIAGYAVQFENALRSAGWGSPTNAPGVSVKKAGPLISGASVSSQSSDKKPKNTPISVKSRTAQGAGAAGAGGVVVLGGAAKEMVDALRESEGAMSAGTWIGLAIGVLIIGGAAYAIYARWTDGRGGK